MEKFTTLTSIAAPLMLENVDTDVITPMELMVTYGFGKNVGRIGEVVQHRKGRTVR